MMPWIVDTCQNSELDEYNELIPEVANKVEKIRRVRNIYFSFDNVRVTEQVDTFLTLLTCIWHMSSSNPSQQQVFWPRFKLGTSSSLVFYHVHCLGYLLKNEHFGNWI
jgi:hypothetical protein